MLNLEQTCNNPHLHSLTRTVIRIRLSAWACQPFCCQRTFFPSLSECPECLRTRLAGLTRSHCANLPSSSAPDSRDFAWCLSCPATRFGNPLRNFFPLSLPLNHCRKIKKPGVERRAQPPTLEWLHALLDFFLPCTRKEPHYRIYFSPSLNFRAGRLLRSDCDAPERSSALQSPRTI